MNSVPWSWRDWLAAAVLLLMLILSLPIFLCMAPWVDASFYDICARVIQRGGVLYRDTFDTNLPGMAWLHLAIRSVFGWRSEVIRAADFLVVAGSMYLLARWDPMLPRQGRIWTAVALLAYYCRVFSPCFCGGVNCLHPIRQSGRCSCPGWKVCSGERPFGSSQWPSYRR